MKTMTRRQLRRQYLKVAGAALATAVSVPALAVAAGAEAQAPGAALQRVGVFCLLGHSIRIVARDTQEALFKDVGMDAVVFETVAGVLAERLPKAEVLRFTAPTEMDVKDQLDVGLAAARRAELPAWVLNAAGQERLDHVLLVGSSTGAMEFNTAMSQVAGNDQVTGVGFYVSASGRSKNMNTGAVSSGYLAPFVQLRMSLLALSGPRVLHTTNLSEGFLVGPPVAEAPDPWQFLNRGEKAQALSRLLRSAAGRGTRELLARV